MGIRFGVLNRDYSVYNEEAVSEIRGLAYVFNGFKIMNFLFMFIEPKVGYSIGKYVCLCLCINVHAWLL